jgi:hypothetical protein
MTFSRSALGPVLTGVICLGAVLAGGCRSDRPASVPKDAVHQVGGYPGENQRMRFIADRDGTFYVTDAWDNSLLYSGPVHAGERVIVNRDAGRVTVNDHVVYEKPMRHTDHWIFFLPS